MDLWQDMNVCFIPKINGFLVDTMNEWSEEDGGMNERTVPPCTVWQR